MTFERPLNPDQAGIGSGAGFQGQKNRHSSILLACVAISVLLLCTAGIAIALLSMAWIAETKRADAEFSAKSELQKQLGQTEAALHAVRQSIDRYVDAVAYDEQLQEARVKDVISKLMEEPLEQYEHFINQNAASNDQETRVDVAQALSRFAVAHALSGHAQEAIRSQLQCVEKWDALANGNPANQEYKTNLAQSLIAYASLCGKANEPETALPPLMRALTIWEGFSREHPAVAEYQDVCAATHYNIGHALMAIGDLEKAVVALERAAEMWDGLARNNRSVGSHFHNLANCQDLLGAIFMSKRQSEETLIAYTRATKLREYLINEYPENAAYQHELAVSQLRLGTYYGMTDEAEGAIAPHERAIEIWEQLSHDYPSDTDFQDHLSSSLNNLGLIYKNIGQPEKASATFVRAIGVSEALTRARPEVVEHAIGLAACCVNLGRLRFESNSETAVGLELIDRAIELLTAALVEVPKDATARLYMRNAHWHRAAMQESLGEWSEAVTDWSTALTFDDSSASGLEELENPRNILRNGLARALALASDYASAAREVEMVISGSDKSAPPLTSSAKYQAACAISLASAAANNDVSLSDADRATIKNEYAARAVEILKQLADSDFFADSQYLQDMEDNPDLDSLRGRSDFQEILQRLSDGLFLLHSPEHQVATGWSHALQTREFAQEVVYFQHGF